MTPIHFGPPLGASEWEGLPVKNHCQVVVNGRTIGLLFLIAHPEIEIDNVVLPLHEFYRFQPCNEDVPILVSSNRQSLTGDLQYYVNLAYPSTSTDSSS